MRVRQMSGARFGGDAPQPSVDALQYGKPPKPVCPIHGIQMKVGSSPAVVRYWYCDYPGCNEGHKEFKRD